MWEYKVEAWGGSTVEDLEKTINRLAARGWRLLAPRDYSILVFERPKQEEPLAPMAMK